MKKPTAYLGIILLFLAGVGVGIGGHSAWMKQKLRQFQKHGPALMRERNKQRLNDKLGLTPEQQSQIDQIMQSEHQKMDALRKKHRQEFTAQKRETIEAIRQVLSEEQQDKLNEILKEHHEFNRQERKKHFPPEPPPELPEPPGPPAP